LIVDTDIVDVIVFRCGTQNVYLYGRSVWLATYAMNDQYWTTPAMSWDGLPLGSQNDRLLWTWQASRWIPDYWWHTGRQSSAIMCPAVNRRATS